MWSIYHVSDFESLLVVWPNHNNLYQYNVIMFTNSTVIISKVNNGENRFMFNHFLSDSSQEYKNTKINHDIGNVDSNLKKCETRNQIYVADN